MLISQTFITLMLNNEQVSRRCIWTDTIIRQQAVQLNCSYNDMFIRC
jgi:hypothetical protein